MKHSIFAKTSLVSYPLGRGRWLMGMMRCGSFRVRQGIVSAVGGAALVSCVWGGPALGATSWSAPQPVSPADVTAVNPQVAAAANGDATVVWAEKSSSGTRIMSSSRTDGGPWGEPQEVSEFGASPVGLHLVMDARVTVAVWVQDAQIMVSRRTDTGVWTRPRGLRTYLYGAQEPQVAVDRRGDITVVWNVSGTVVAVRRPVGGHWGSTLTLSKAVTDGSQVDEEPQVAMDGRGDTTVTWLRYFGEYKHLSVMRARRPMFAGHWLAPVRVAPGILPHVAMSLRGDTLLTWEDNTSGQNVLKTDVRPPGGRWHIHALASNITDAGVGDVAMDRNGDVTVVWTEDPRTRANGDSYRVLAALRPSGGSWRNPVRLSAPGTQAHDPHVAVGGDGTTTVTWSHFDIQNGAFAGNVDIQGVQRAPTAPWDAAQSISNDRPGEGGQVAMDNRGHAVAVWVDAAGTKDRIMVTSS